MVQVNTGTKWALIRIRRSECNASVIRVSAPRVALAVLASSATKATVRHGRRVSCQVFDRHVGNAGIENDFILES